MIFQSRKPLNRQELAALDNRSTLTFMAEQRKFRWLVATGVLGLAGVTAIGAVVFLTGHSGTTAVATKAISPVKVAGMAPARHQPAPVVARVNTPATPAAPMAGSSKPPRRMAPAARINVAAKADQLMVIASLPPAAIPKTDAAPALAPESAPPVSAPATQRPALKGKVEAARPVTVPEKIVLPPLPVRAARKPEKPPAFINKLITVTKGDTLYSLLQRNGVRKQDAQAAINSLKPVYAAKDLYIGQKISLSLARASWSAPLKPVKLRITPRGGKGEVGIQMTARGKYRTFGENRKLARLEPTRSAAKKGRKSTKPLVYRR
ncbi:MAG TPA: hypothetical protein ENJ99_01815, partial [Rhizobiales bacterium]|nr:hypothetical protein [Hyphomicrobiales bacterium]